MAFDPNSFEPKWRKYWADNKTYRALDPNETDKPKYYVLDMFPYPSGAGLHVGHPLGYIASDIYARYKRMDNYNVLHPMGFDAFGLPAEEYAILTGIHPEESTTKNIARYREQLDRIGFSFDWDRQVKTSEPNYYKWTQWAFARMYEHYYDTKANKALPIADLVAYFEHSGSEGNTAFNSAELSFTAAEWNAFDAHKQAEVLMDYRLAYRHTGTVNWCEALQTILANDQVKDGLSERGGHPVTKRKMLQWNLRTTAYADRLLASLDKLDWSDSLKLQQTNWIGKSVGCEMQFAVDGQAAGIDIFTTRPDTIFGTTFMVLAPEHELVKQLTTAEYQEAVDAYVQKAATLSNIERQSEAYGVTGQFTGAYAINPVTKAKLPIYIADYVLIDYGTGAIMAVPAEDERDRKFADKFALEVKEIVSHEKGKQTLINSDFLNGLEVTEAKKKAVAFIAEQGYGFAKVNYKLRDANFSRQRYWGEPFPVIYDKDGAISLVPDEQLPVELPKLENFAPTSDGKGPVARVEDWVNVGNGAKREVDTMPAVAGSSWYFLRYMDPSNADALADRSKLDYWQNVDLYVGGTEHAVSHLMYARFWQKFLFDLDIVPVDEPFKKLINQGMIQGVIESALLHKTNNEFVSYDLLQQPIEDLAKELKKAKKEKLGKEVVVGLKEQLRQAKDQLLEYAEMPVHIDFVEQYGSDDSYLSAEGIDKFKAWNKSFADKAFRCNDEGHFVTKSEIGKMSKSKFNVINPDDVIAEYGADTFRMYEMFLGPIEQHKPWNTQGIDGVYKFLKRFNSLYFNEEGQSIVVDDAPSKAALKSLHTAIKKVRADIESFGLNTCVSAFMVCVNELKAEKCHSREILEPLVRLLAPFAPYITEELYHQLHPNAGSVHLAAMPKHDEKYLVESEIEYPISINGKKKSTILLDANLSKVDIEVMAPNFEAIQRHIEGKQIRKIIVVPKRMINIVVG